MVMQLSMTLHLLQRHETTSSTQGLAFNLSTLLHARTAHIHTILSNYMIVIIIIIMNKPMIHLKRIADSRNSQSQHCCIEKRSTHDQTPVTHSI